MSKKRGTVIAIGIILFIVGVLVLSGNPSDARTRTKVNVQEDDFCLEGSGKTSKQCLKNLKELQEEGNPCGAAGVNYQSPRTYCRAGSTPCATGDPPVSGTECNCNFVCNT